MPAAGLASGGTRSPHDVIRDVALDPLVKVLSARFLPGKATLSLLPWMGILLKTSSLAIRHSAS